jgi:hypothetical protein
MIVRKEIIRLCEGTWRLNEKYYSVVSVDFDHFQENFIKLTTVQIRSGDRQYTKQAY